MVTHLVVAMEREDPVVRRFLTEMEREEHIFFKIVFQLHQRDQPHMTFSSSVVGVKLKVHPFLCTNACTMHTGAQLPNYVYLENGGCNYSVITV